MVSIVSINSFSVGTTGEAPLRPPPAVITISDAITTANLTCIDGLYRKKPNEMPQKSRLKCHKKPNGKVEYEEKLCLAL